MTNALQPATQELVSVVQPAATEFTAVDIPPGDIIEGTPQMHMGPVWTSADGSKMSGVSRMSRGRFWFDQPHHETTHLLTGHMIITLADGTAIELRAGDLVHLQPGARWELNVLEPVEDFWVVTSAHGPVGI